MGAARQGRACVIKTSLWGVALPSPPDLGFASATLPVPGREKRCVAPPFPL
ncbi:hypothetical protein BREVUG8_110336 [Brevundimonas sp. G8]|nr:hypothetical protein BREVUG8_110336 [Brevundimonas sp. G8]